MKSISNSHLTAISRKTLPVPVRWLLSQGMIHGHVLDYGCGKCAEINAAILNTAPGVSSVVSYDPYFAPDALRNSARERFDVVLNTYVLCTLPEDMERAVLKGVQNHLLPNGVAYITVRNDEPPGGYGVSSKGTFQRKVSMPYLYEVRRTSTYSIYLLTRETKLI